MAKLKPRSREAVARAVREQESAHANRVLDLWTNSVPLKYRGFSLADARKGWAGDSLTDSGRVSLERYLRDPHSGFLLIHGSAGTGKTSLAVTVATDLIRREQVGAKMVNSVILMNEFSFDHDTNPAKTYGEVPILLIDDLGAVNEGITANQRKLLWAVIEDRWANKRITILTTNMALNQQRDGIGLADWIGSSGWDRITDGLTRIMLEGDSLRDED